MFTCLSLTALPLALTALTEMERDVKIGKITKEMQIEQKVEILAALRSLGEQVWLQSIASILMREDLWGGSGVSREAQHSSAGCL